MLARVPRTAVAHRGFAAPLRLTRALATSSQPSKSYGDPPPSGKISTMPFLLEPPAALHKLHTGALVSSGRPSNLIYASLLNFFGPRLATLAQELGYSSGIKQKGELKAVLWPGWRVDAALEGKVKVSAGDKGDKQLGVDVFCTTPGAYVPGNAFAPLSYLSHVSPIENMLDAYVPEYNLTQLKSKYDMDVVPIPFTVSPVGLAKHLRKVAAKQNNREDSIADEAQWKEVMLACYPILFPMYIAEFTYDDKETGQRTIPVIVEAHSYLNWEIQLSFPPPPQLADTARFGQNFFVGKPFITDTTIASSHVPIAASSQQSDLAKPFMLFNSYMAPGPNRDNPETVDPSPMLAVQEEDEPEGVNWDDPRIQDWCEPVRKENGEWLTRKAAYEAARRSLEIARDGSAPSSGAWVQLEQSLHNEGAAVEEAKPQWLKLWDKARKAIKTTTKTGKK
ncbi:hypothetical protein IAT38_007076 [Cryptococcus sp. DSM 104549]